MDVIWLNLICLCNSNEVIYDKRLYKIVQIRDGIEFTD